MNRPRWVFSERSWRNLHECHPDLLKLAPAALLRSPYDFGIIDGARTLAEQQELKKTPATSILRSRHRWAWPLSAKGNRLRRFSTPVSHAFDFGVYVRGRLVWSFDAYREVWEQAFKPAAAELGIRINWGGHWKSMDGPHIQLAWKHYPAAYASEEEERVAVSVKTWTAESTWEVEV